MRKFLDALIEKNMRLYTIVAYGIMLFIAVCAAYYFMPILLNYGPNTINTEFDMEFSSGFTYLDQFLVVFVAIYLCEIIWLLVEMREFSNIGKLNKEKGSSKANYEKYLRIVQKCYTIPKMSFAFIAIVPTIAVAVAFFFLNFTSFADFKVLLVVAIIALLCGTMTFLVSKRIFKSILQSLVNTTILQKGKLKITPSVVMQIMPIAIIAIMYTFFISYSNNLDDKALIVQKHYENEIIENLNKNNPNSIDELNNILYNSTTLFFNDSISIIDKNGTVYSYTPDYTTINVKVNPGYEQYIDNTLYFKDENGSYYYFSKYGLIESPSIPDDNSFIVTDIIKEFLERNKGEYGFENITINIMSVEDSFFYTYAYTLANKSNNIVYGYYGSEIQGTIIPIRIGSTEVNIVVKYDLSSGNMKKLFMNLAILLLGCFFVVYYFAGSMAKDISLVTDGINKLLEGNAESLNKNLPVTSNDELGELVIAFNKIQELTKENIVEIKSNEQRLMEKERLASLGELIGGIAHNLKTPIMSVAGAAEGLTELITEYRASIDNPVVTPDDHKEIAKDMLEWVTKIKSHTQYMSDIITTVKGQASQLASSEADNFTLYDLSKRVEILIKHEIKQALLVLKADILCDPSITIHGDINSLIQVINNLISNSIYAYKGVPDKVIDFVINADDSNIFISVSDEGCGMNEETKSKLFKQMYTTKGKEGTGLGLYMSYSTIRGKFSGNMTFESTEGKGTTFTITIPRNRN